MGCVFTDIHVHFCFTQSFPCQQLAALLVTRQIFSTVQGTVVPFAMQYLKKMYLAGKASKHAASAGADDDDDDAESMTDEVRSKLTAPELESVMGHYTVCKKIMSCAVFCVWPLLLGVMKLIVWGFEYCWNWINGRTFIDCMSPVIFQWINDYWWDNLAAWVWSMTIAFLYSKTKAWWWLCVRRATVKLISFPLCVSVAHAGHSQWLHGNADSVRLCDAFLWSLSAGWPPLPNQQYCGNTCWCFQTVLQSSAAICADSKGHWCLAGKYECLHLSQGSLV